MYTIYGMADNSSSRRLKENLAALIKYHKRSWNYVASEAGGGGSFTALVKDMRPIGLDRLDRAAAVFGLEGWHLLVPNLDPKDPPTRWLGKDEAKKHAKLEKAQRLLEEQD